MKQIWFGVGLLAVLLVLGISSSAFMEHTHLTQAENLKKASDFAMTGNWSAAKNLSSGAQREWDRKQPLIAALCDHEPMDQIEGLFAQLEVFTKAEDAVSYSSTCLYLASQLEALGESHSLNFQNFF